MSSVIEFEHVSKRFRLRRDRPRSLQEFFLNALRMRASETVETIWSLLDVSFHVPRGEMVGIIGANGAGKSTALKLVSRILEPTEGRVIVKGRVTGLLELGAGFHPDLTGRENVYLNGSILGMRRKTIESRLDAIVEFAELQQFIDVPVKHYSSGMFMRLGFATAVHSDADVLLVDEVLAVGDQAFQSRCLERIGEMRRGGTTILLVSHDASTIRRMCDRAVWLHKGKVESLGTADSVIADYMEQVWQQRSEQLEERVQREEGDDNTEHGDQAQEPSAQRWGSGEAVVEDVVFLGIEGAEQRVFRTGERLVARISYQAHKQVERPAFGVAIYRDDGAHVNGPNSVVDGYQIPTIVGKGRIDYIVEALPLTPGRYEFTAAIYDYGSTHAFDHRHRAFTFEVQAGSMGAREGLVHMPSVWEHRK